MKIPKLTFGVVLFCFQVLLLALYAKYVNYQTIPSTTTSSVYFAQTYPKFQDVHVMIFVGFAFLMTFLKKYSFGAVSYNLLIASVVIQWSILLNQWIKQRVLKEEGHYGDKDPLEINLGLMELMTADFTAAAVLITFGALLGKASRLQLLCVAIVECIFFAINETILVEYLHISDVGGSIVVHLFGAYFGLSVAFMLRNSGDEHTNESSVYHSDVFAMVGTLFLWVFWPSFNAGPLTDPVRQNRAVINTYLALAACVATTFMASSWVDKRFKLNMVHLQNATIAGGVAVGTSADLMIRPWGAILIGMLAGILSVIGYTYITPFLNKKLRIHDTCGVHNLHGMPAIFAAICGAIAAASIKITDYGNEFADIYPKVGSGDRSRAEQGGFQFAAAVVTFAIAVFGGLLTGAVLRCLDSPDELLLYDDDNEFEVPDQFISIKTESNGTSDKQQYHMHEQAA